MLLLDDVSSAVDAAASGRLITAIRHVARDRIIVVAGHGALIDAADVGVRLCVRAEVQT